MPPTLRFKATRHLVCSSLRGAHASVTGSSKTGRWTRIGSVMTTIGVKPYPMRPAEPAMRRRSESAVHSIIHWNTVYRRRAVDYLLKQGLEPDSSTAPTSAYSDRHVRHRKAYGTIPSTLQPCRLRAWASLRSNHPTENGAKPEVG